MKLDDFTGEDYFVIGLSAFVFVLSLAGMWLIW